MSSKDQPMLCPVDGEILTVIDRLGIRIETCPKCRGVWLDRGELDKIIERATAPVFLPDPEPGPKPEVEQDQNRKAQPDQPISGTTGDNHRYSRRYSNQQRAGLDQIGTQKTVKTIWEEIFGKD